MARPDRLALTARRRVLLGGIRTTTATAVGRVWSALPDHTAAGQPVFAAKAGPDIVAGQSKAISLSVAYVAAVTGVAPQLDRQAVLAGAAVDLASPFYAFGAHLNDGEDPEEALAAGLDAAMSMASDGVTWASRSAGSAFDHSDRVTGWERIPDGGACDWCIEVADQTYLTADTASFGHANCGCEVEPLLAGG
jgi:hypothetical protein